MIRRYHIQRGNEGGNALKVLTQLTQLSGTVSQMYNCN